MKKSMLLNSDLSSLVARLGHTDEITICDAGLPISQKTQRIDLALTHGVPGFLETVKVVLSELQIEGAIIAEEFAKVSPKLHAALLKELEEEQRQGNPIAISYIPHQEFKTRSQQGVGVVRTGECTSFANVIFQTGVTF